MDPITELVELQLAQPFDDFIVFFEAEQLPVLLSAPGMISVRTGMRQHSFILIALFDFLQGPKLLRPSNLPDKTTAVSVTLWESLEAHETFLRSEPAKGFFQRVSQWIRSPPTVLHYELGGLHGLEKLAFIAVIPTAKNGMEFFPQMDGMGLVYKSGNCVEDRTKSILMVFLPSLAGVQSLQERVQEDFSVHSRNFRASNHTTDPRKDKAWTSCLQALAQKSYQRAMNS
ncbi:hypothetical protein G6011_10135 [Alternaria panax]|uniref:Uncharacterized protein n=1 Tax=Alternaria panax TaxID=48097 RepID=A0AAD4FBM5_9PLEO|nr:hypothetical protein G6011_10135 [Alternaria panax]